MYKVSYLSPSSEAESGNRIDEYFTKENILNLMPENNPLQTERIFKNEVVGEFFSGAGLPITRAEIYEKCRDVQ